MSEDSDSITEHEIDEAMANQNTIPLLPTHKRQTFIWKFFSPVPDHSNVFRCNVCNETFANRTTNLTRHLQSVHGLTEVSKIYCNTFLICINYYYPQRSISRIQWRKVGRIAVSSGTFVPNWMTSVHCAIFVKKCCILAAEIRPTLQNIWDACTPKSYRKLWVWKIRAKDSFGETYLLSG